MARRARTQADVNLFPFLSVLCAMIGVLVLFLLVTTTTRVQHAVADTRSLPPPPPPPERKIEPGDGLEEQEYQRLQEQLDELTTQLVERQREFEGLNRLINQLADLIAAKQDEQLPAAGDGDYVEGIALEPKEDVEMVQEKNVHVTKEPCFVEITADEYIVHPEGLRYAVGQIEQPGSQIQKFLVEFDKKHTKQYLIMLLHPNASNAFWDLYKNLKSSHPQINVGYEPFSSGWLLISNDRVKQDLKR